MLKKITLSENSKKLITQLVTLKINLPEAFTQPSLIDMDFDALATWLDSSPKADPFLLRALKGNLVNDLQQSLFPVIKKNVKPPLKKTTKLKLFLLAIAGAIFLGCEGFDVLTSILSVFFFASAGIFVLSAIFAILTIIFIFSIELLEISQSFGVKMNQTPTAVAIYLKEFKSIKQIRKELSKDYLKKDLNELSEYLLVVELLLKRQQALNEERLKLKTISDNKLLKSFKFILDLITGLLIFMSGYLAGQTVALSCASLFFVTVLPTFWPIIVTAVAIGIVGSFFWFVKRPELNNLLSQWFGLSSSKINLVVENTILENEKDKLQNLKSNLISYKTVLEKSLSNSNTTLEKPLTPSGKKATSLTLFPSIAKKSPSLQRSYSADSLSTMANKVESDWSLNP